MTDVVKQSAVIPVRQAKKGLEVLLITSRNTGRWVIPKGNIKKGLTPAKSAYEEALEEAGVKGKVYDRKLGRYRYTKPEGPTQCDVIVFLMKVEKEMSEWPEKNERRRKWFPAKKAAERVAEKRLSKILANSHLAQGSAFS